MQRGIIRWRIDPLTQRLEQFPCVLCAVFTTHHRHDKRTQFGANLWCLQPNLHTTCRSDLFGNLKKKREKGHDFVQSMHSGETHLLYEDLEHRPTIRHVAAEARATRVCTIARDLLCLRVIHAVVAYGISRAIEASCVRATNVHHHAGRVAVRAMHDVVLVEKTQTLCRPLAVT